MVGPRPRGSGVNLTLSDRRAVTSEQSVPVMIVGAGQAGLSVAYYLRRFELVSGRDFVIYDRGPEAGGAWQHRWESLRLGTTFREWPSWESALTRPTARCRQKL